MRTWQEAWEILKDIPTEDYISGTWPEIRVNKVKALFELAHEVKPGTCIVDLGTWRGLAAFTLALGSDDGVTVYTLDDYSDRRVEEVANVGLRYNMADYDQFLTNLDKMPDDIRARVLQQQVEILYAADRWFGDPVGLVFWDIWGERLIDDIKAWVPHVVEGGLVVVKVFEDGRLHHERLYALPGLKEDKHYPEGVIYTMRRTKEQETAHAIWIVDGDKYVAEAGRSAASVQKHMPHLTTSVYQPEKRVHAEWFIETTRLLEEILKTLPDEENVLWLDSDTYMLEPVNDLLGMLSSFGGYDMALAHAPGHVTGPTRDILPDCFPEFNIGVIAFVNSAKVRRFWYDLWDRQRALKDIYGNNDQAPLREALFDGVGGLRYVVIPSEYNFRFQFGGQVRDRVKILHGHASSAEAYEAIGESVNKGWTEGYQIPPRLWSPDVFR